MSTGLIALLDDVAAIAKMAAATLDDAAAQAAKAGSKAAGIVIDDAAVTPRYVVGFAADRELPIIAKIARGSLINKMLILLPGALILSLVAPWIITPLLMLGGAYLCMEGFHKVLDLVRPHAAHADSAEERYESAQAAEDAKVASAIRTDFILSAEIMAISLAAVAALSLAMKAAVLAVVGLGMTALVYGAVALIVKADDVGLALSRSPNSGLRALGRGLVLGMPGFLKGLSLVGMVAMLWVGGGIVIHGLAGLGFAGPEHAIHDMAHAIGAVAPAAEGVIAWVVTAAISGAVGLALGALVAPLADHVIAPLAARIRRWASPRDAGA
jgi:predicted DNA repair protein MutK